MANICSIFDSTEAPKDDSGQFNFKKIIQLERTKEEEALKFELKPLPEELKYVYLRDQ